jgi:putative protease
MTDKITLPLVAPAPTPSGRWHGWTALEAPEPIAPQGAYSDLAPLAAAPPLIAPASVSSRTELLAPAGGLEAGFAAFHFGADAIYLGLKKFSARAEAENFTLDEVNEITAYAHGLQPRRRVFVTINTLIRQDELAELIDALAGLAEIGVDAVILQDLGVYRALRRFFPRLELHSSTQMAVHNAAGALALHRLGFERVVLARELTFEEVRDVTGAAGIETEVFIHGALCYSYSGLCLFSAQTLGRSGNRGKCAYSCRDSYDVTGAPLELRDGAPVKRDPRQGFPFSMKDLALPDHLPALRGAGVSCFKIEGRKKSPLYVASTTDYYRRLLDGKLAAEARPGVEADLQTVFSRPWTRLFVQSHRDKEVADRDTVGHRGTPIGQVEAVKNGRLRFRTRRALERHDGLQIDLPVLGKPFGFAVERLWVLARNRGQDAFAAPPGALVEVSLPPEHPQLPVGAPVYCSSSQAVKQKYRYHRPKPGAWRVRAPLSIRASLTAESLSVTARLRAADGAALEVRRSLPGPFAPARDGAQMDEVVRATFARLGDTAFTLADFSWDNQPSAFVPISRLNALRRGLVQELEAQVANRRVAWTARIRHEALGEKPHATDAAAGPRHREPFRWSIKVDRIDFLDAFESEDWRDLDEVIIDIARAHPTELRERLGALSNQVGRQRIRLALPALTRAWEDKGIRHKIETLLADGWTKWEAANLSAWSYLGVDPLAENWVARPEQDAKGVGGAASLSRGMGSAARPSRTQGVPPGTLDLATDWSVYVLNRLAAEQVLAMGATRFALSPEDGLNNWRSLLSEFGDQAVLIVHQDTPLFIAESCAYANLIGGCPGKANCQFESMEMTSSHGEKVTALDYHCRTIVLNQGPFCLSTRLPEMAAAGARLLRADFVYRPYEPLEVRRRWRLVRAGKPIPGGHAANFERGML